MNYDNNTQLTDLIDTNVNFDTVYEYNHHVFYSLYKKNLLQALFKSSSYYGSHNVDYYVPFFNDNTNQNLYWKIFPLKCFLDIYTERNSKYFSLPSDKEQKCLRGYQSFNPQKDELIAKNLSNYIPDENSVFYKSHSFNNIFPAKFIMKTTLFLFANNEHFNKIFFKSIKKSHISESCSLIFINLLNSFENKNNLLFKNFSESILIKKLAFNTKEINIDSRSEIFLKLANNLSENFKNNVYTTLLKKLTDKEKIVAKNLITLADFPPEFLSLYNQNLSKTSFNININKLNDPKQLSVNSEINDLTQRHLNISIPLNNIYAFYKNLYNKSNFPLYPNISPKFNIEFDSIKINGQMYLNSYDKLILNITFSCSINQIDKMNDFTEYFNSNYFYFIDNAFTASYQLLSTENNNSFFSKNNPQSNLSTVLLSFLQEMRENSIQKNLVDKQDIVIKKNKI